MLKKLDNARRKAEILAVNHTNEDEQSKDKQIVTDSDIRDILRVL